MIVTVWNCNMAFNLKYAATATLDSDVLIVPECANREVLHQNGLTFSPESFIWVGENKNKGLAVVARPPYKLTRLFEANDALPIWSMPIRIGTPLGRNVDLIAVWSKCHLDKRNEEGNPVTQALKQFGSAINVSNLLVAGDFNNNIRWDTKKEKSTNHRTTSGKLRELGLVSAYHSQGGHAYEEEPHPTLYWRGRPAGRVYHIDYIYAPIAWLNSSTDVSVGSRELWVQTKLSDHVPLTVVFKGIG